MRNRSANFEPMASPEYIELHARSAFSFLRGGSLPEHLAGRAAELGYSAFGVCDRMGVYGAPRVFAAGRESGVRPVIGAELVMDDGSILPVLVETQSGYRNLCRLLTKAHLRSAKGDGMVRWDELPEFSDGLVALSGDEEGPLVRSLRESGDPGSVVWRLLQIFGGEHVFIEIQRHLHRC